MADGVLEGEVVADPRRELDEWARRAPVVSPWTVVGEPVVVCRCSHPCEDHLAWRCAIDGCECRELLPYAEVRTEQRTVLVAWEARQ